MKALSKFLTSPLWVGLVFILLYTGCSVDSAKNHYLLAEKLWTDQKYGAAVTEFEKVISKDRRGKLGLQAMFRAATTQYIFLSKYGDAIRNFRNFVQLSGDARQVWEAQLEIGEILFSKTEQYDQAIQHYRALLQQKPTTSETAEFLFRIAKSQFFLFQFSDAVSTFEEVIRKYPQSQLAEKALYEVGTTYLTQGNESFEPAKTTFEKFINRYPKSPLVADAKFGIASCLEELDQLDEAYGAFEAIKNSYPSPYVIEVKLSRIRQRISQRRASR